MLMYIPNMKQIQEKKSKRYPLFTKKERDYLQGKISFSRVRKAQFHDILEERFDEFLKDLELLQNSENLEIWRNIKAPKYKRQFIDTYRFNNVFSTWKRTYPDKICRIKTRKKKIRILYWLEHDMSERIDERLFHSSFLFRQLRIQIPEDDKKLLVDAYERQNILPYKKENAITLQEIKNRLNRKSKIITPDTTFQTIILNNYKNPKNQQIHKIIERTKKSLEKKLAGCDSGILHWEIEPKLHSDDYQDSI